MKVRIYNEHDSFTSGIKITLIGYHAVKINQAIKRKRCKQGQLTTKGKEL